MDKSGFMKKAKTSERSEDRPEKSSTWANTSHSHGNIHACGHRHTIARLYRCVTMETQAERPKGWHTALKASI